MNPESLDPNLAKAPLVIAVTGHRDLREQDIEKLRAVVQSVLRELRADFGSTPFILLSPLAEGADRLVATEALEPGIRTQLVVPLPMPEDMYVQDFPASIGEFKELLTGHHKIELELISPRNEVAMIPSLARDKQYEGVGKYIVRQCQILLALWDGVESEEVGATSAVVGFQRRGLPPEAGDDLQPPELFPVCHIVTPHIRTPEPPDAFKVHELYPEAFAAKDKKANNKKAQDYYRKLFGNLKKFNNYIDHGSASFQRTVMESRGRIMGEPAPFTLSASEEQNLCRYAVADVMALRFHDYVQWANRTMQGLVFLTFLSFVLFAHSPGHPALALMGSFALFAMGYGVQWWAKHEGLDARSQDYRAMAEACRVRFFWRIAGINDGIADNYLGMQRTELDWIRNTLRGWDTIPENSPQTDPDKRLQFLRIRWVDQELEFYKDRSEKYEKKLKRGEVLMKVCLMVAVLLAGLTFLWHVFFHGARWLHCHDCEIGIFWWVIPIDLFLAAGALLHHSLYRRALSQHIKQYNRMKVIFQRASEFLKTNQEPDEIPKCLRKLGQEALKENGDWVLLHRERPLELSHP